MNKARKKTEARGYLWQSAAQELACGIQEHRTCWYGQDLMKNIKVKFTVASHSRGVATVTANCNGLHCALFDGSQRGPALSVQGVFMCEKPWPSCSLSGMLLSSLWPFGVALIVHPSLPYMGVYFLLWARHGTGRLMAVSAAPRTGGFLVRVISPG